jgi:hypothetical protein
VSEPMMPYEPMPPVGGQQPPAKPKVPREVNIAFAVWVLSTLLSTILQSFGGDAFVKEYQRAAAGQPTAQVDPNTLKTAFIVGVVIVGLLMLFFAWKMRSGRNWARIVLTVLAVLGLLFQASSVGLSEPLALIGVLITIVGLVFMYMPAANAYFAEVRKQLLQQRLRR